MPQSTGYGEAEILRIGIRPGEACPPSDWPPLPNFRSSLRLRVGALDLTRDGCATGLTGLCGGCERALDVTVQISGFLEIETQWISGN
jgi:hypothetical protein